MAESPARPYPTHCLAHLVEESVTAEVTVRTYELHEIPVLRPASGRAVVALRCGTCGEPVDCVVDSVADTEAHRRQLARRRQRSLVLRWCCLAAALLGFGWVVALDTLDGRFAWIVAAAVLGCVVAFMVLTLAASRMAADSRARDGVILADPSGAHRLRPPGDDREVVLASAGLPG